MIQKALEYVASLSHPISLVFGGREYTDKKIYPVSAPLQHNLGVSTLTAVEDYFRDNPDNIDLSKAVVHIRSHQAVSVVSAVQGEWIERHDYLVAIAEPKQFPFGQYMDIESFIIALQSYFIQNDTTSLLMKVVSSIVDDTSIKYLDDGVTQQVNAKTGIAKIENIVLPNPVTLAPYRTFLEVAQPDSAFVFRLKKSESGPTAALFEADGGNWRLEAIKRIRDYFRIALPDGTVILA